MLLSLLSKRSLEVDSRDAYGFVLRPQHIQTYREYANIYQEEEEERSAKWEEFLERHMQSTAPCLAKDKKATFNSEGSGSVKQEACAAEQNKRSQVTFSEFKEGNASKEEAEETSKSESKEFNDTTASEDGSEAALNGNDIEAKENIFSEAHNVTTVAETTDSKEGTNSNEKVENKSSKAYSVPGDENSESLQDEGTELKDEAAPRDPMKETLEAKSDALVEETGTEGTTSEDGSEAALNVNDIEAKENIFSEAHNVTTVAETTDSKEGTNSNEKVENKASKADGVPGDENSESLQDDGTELKDEEAAPKDPMKETLEAKSDALVEEAGTEGSDEGNTSSMKSELVGPTETETKEQVQVTKKKRVQQWARTRPALLSIENLMSSRVKRAKYIKDEDVNPSVDHLLSTKEEGYCREESKNGFHENVDISEIVGENVNIFGKESNQGDSVSSESFSRKVELESLVCGGVPKDLRGEVWQAFVGVKARRVENYYQNLLAEEATDAEHNNSSNVSRKWKRQIEKDLPRTFPGHPALNDVGRESLRRVLLAYARHNPTVGYCQAMNFFAGLLLLLMPEENAFWTLLGIVDDYFDGCYTEEMVESQVDQLVFDELMRERFPKLVNHLDYLGVQMAWISGPWFLSIFVNVLPWESVLRVWDVLLFEGNRVILFRTAFALMELYGPALITTRDAGDAITLLQSLAGSTFDSSQLVLTACMGFLAVTEERLKELRDKHRPSVQGVFEERDTGQPPKDPKGLASKLKSFKHDGRLPREESKSSGVPGDGNGSDVEPDCFDEFLNSLAAESENSLPDLQDQVDWMKVELCRLLEEKRSAILRAEELEIALTEMVQNDNRRQLTAKIEQLKRENADLQQSIADKREQESAMLKVLMRLEQEQKFTEEGRRKAEQEAVAQKFAVKVLEEKYEEAMIALVQMEKRAVVAETMLEASKKYESGQAKALCSPRAWRSCGEGSSSPGRRGLLSFGLGWLEKTKGKPRPEETGDSRSGPSSSEKMLIP